MIDDTSAHDLLVQVADGRTPKQIAALIHVAHEQLMWQSEQAKFAALPPSPDPVKNPQAWAAHKAFILDGQGTESIETALGLAVQALLSDDMPAFRFKMHGVLKACLAKMPQVRRVIEASRASAAGGQAIG